MSRPRPRLCYRSRTWELIELPPEAAPGWQFALDRIANLQHDAAEMGIQHMLASAYLQGMMDAVYNDLGAKVRALEADTNVGEERMGL